MGSRISCSGIDTSENINRISSINDKNSNVTKENLSDVYIKDKFQLEFLDCNCCCDTTKKIANCDFQGINILQNLYEMVITPEYKLNCHCLCGDKNKQSIKFGLTESPNVDIISDTQHLSDPISSDSKLKQ